MALEFSTAGMTLKYCVETTKGTRPTTGYTEIPEVKSIPSFGDEPNALQTTPLNATKYHTYTEGLRDTGGAWGITVNDCPTFRTAWSALMTAVAGLTGGKACWFEIVYPADANMDSFYFTADPVALSFGGAEVDSVLENTAYLMPNAAGEPTFAAASTGTVNPNIVTVAKSGGTATVTVSSYSGTLTATSADTSKVTVAVSGDVVTFTGATSTGNTTVDIKVNGTTVATIPVTVTA